MKSRRKPSEIFERIRKTFRKFLGDFVKDPDDLENSSKKTGDQLKSHQNTPDIQISRGNISCLLGSESTYTNAFELKSRLFDTRKILIMGDYLNFHNLSSSL